MDFESTKYNIGGETNKNKEMFTYVVITICDESHK